MMELNYNIHVCSLTDRGILGPEFEKMGIPVYTLNIDPYVYNLKALFRLVRLIKKIKPQIVQTHIYPANTLGRTAAFFANVPIIIGTEHGLYRWKKKHQFLIDRVLAIISDKIIVVSNAAKKHIYRSTKIPVSKLQTIYNFIDIETFIPKKSKDALRQEFGVSDLDFIVGSVGRIVKEKGYDILLQSINLLRGRGYSFKYIVVGDGKYLKTLKSNACAADLSRDIIFTGFRSDIADILQIFDIFVLPTLDEGFGISIIEAQIMGLPVIASSVDAIPEIIQNGYNGLLIPPNDPNSLANEIEYLYKNAGSRSEIGIRAKESVVERFSARVSINNLDDVYTQLLKKSIQDSSNNQCHGPKRRNHAG